MELQGKDKNVKKSLLMKAATQGLLIPSGGNPTGSRGSKNTLLERFCDASHSNRIKMLLLGLKGN